MLRILKEYGIEKKIGYFTLDNAGNNDTCMQELGLELNFNHRFRRLRCAGHMINLMAKQVLFGKESNVFDLEAASLSTDNDLDTWRQQGPIGKLHRITTWIYKSGQRKARFHKAQETMGIKKSETLDLVKDVKTRWNSTHDMIKRAKRLKQGLDYFIDKEALEERAGIGGADAGYVIENRLSKEDWEILEEYVEFLDPLAVATKVLQSNPGKHSAGQQKQGLAANVLLAFEYILNHMEKMNEKYQGQGAKDRHLSAVVELAWDKCTEYYRKLDDTPIYIAGVILNPSHKWQRLETLWGGSKKTRRWIQEGKAKIKAFWESDYKTFEVPDDTPREQSTRSEFELFLEGRSQKDPLAPLDEYDNWCQLEPFEHHNALSYWIENRS